EKNASSRRLASSIGGDLLGAKRVNPQLGMGSPVAKRRRGTYHRAPHPDPTGVPMDDLLALAADPTVWAALATLIAMEVVLGIDNLIFISILTNKLPEDQRSRGRRIGIGLALI